MNTKLNLIYKWEIQTIDDVILNQYDENGCENSWKTLELDKIIRASFIPTINIFPRHDVIIDIEKGDRFIKRFSRGFISQKTGFKLSECVNCFVTNKYRLYVFSTNGRSLITHKDYELYI